MAYFGYPEAMIAWCDAVYINDNMTDDDKRAAHLTHCGGKMDGYDIHGKLETRLTDGTIPLPEGMTVSDVMQKTSNAAIVMFDDNLLAIRDECALADTDLDPYRDVSIYGRGL